MKLWRVLALSVAACAAAAAHVPGATAEDQAAANSEYDNNGNDGLFSFITQELQRSSALVQRFFFDEATQENAQQTAPVQIVILDDGEEDGIENVLFPLQEGERAQELTRQEQQLACLTALKMFHEQDELKQEQQQLSQRLRSPFKRAFQVMSLHYFDEASCDDFKDSRLVDECNRVLDMEDAVRQYMTRGRTDEQVCVLVNEKDQETEPKQVGGELSCKLCKRFVQMIVQALAQEVSQVQVVREIIGDICDSMAEDSMCHTFLKQYDQIVDWLKHGTDPATVCLRIMMCEKKNQLQQLSDLTANALVKDESEDHACFYCVYIVYVVAKVNEIMPSQLNNVRTLIKWGCTISPKDCKCDLLVTNYDKIVGWVKQDKKPNVICEALNICKKKDNAFAIEAPDATVEEALTALMPLVQRDMGQDDKKCFYCDYVTTLIQVALQEDPDHVGEIRMYADMICGMLGDTNQCHQYVTKLDTVIDELKKGQHPREICATMKYCGAKLSAIDASTQTTVTAFTFISQDEKACLYCDYIAIAMQIILQQDADQVNEIREYADMICGFLGPDNVCHQYVDKFDAMIDQLKQGKRPRDICVGLKYCTSKSKADVEPFQKALTAFVVNNRAVDVQDDKKCFYCDYIATLVQIIMQEDPDQVNEIREYADMICGFLGPDNICHQYVDKLDIIIDQLKKGQHPREICTSLKYCGAKLSAIDGSAKTAMAANALVKDESEDHACFYCVYIVYVVAKVNEIMPSQLNNVRTLIKWGCTISPKDCKCDLLVTNYDKIVGWVKQDKKPNVICEALNICKKKDNAFAIEAPDATVEEALTALMPLVQRDMGQDDKKCFYCDYVTTLIQVALQEDPDHVGEIRMYADMICGMLGDTNQCHQYVTKLDTVIDELKKGQHPREICATMKYCGAKLSAIDASTQTTVTAFTFISQDEKACLYCDYIAIAMQIILQQDADQVNEIREYADMICGFLGPDNVCHQYVDKFDAMIDQLKQGKRPRDICVGLKYCTSKSKADVEPFQKALTAFVVNNRAVDVQDDKKCFYCDYIATLVQIIMQEDPDQVNEIREYADMICGFLGPDNICHQYVDKLDIIIDQLKKGQHPREICTSLKYCGAKTKALASTAHGVEDLASFDQHLVKIVKNSMESAIDGCFVCTQLASILEVALAEDPSQIDQIRQIGDLVCGFLPSESKCRPVMDELDKVIDSLKKGEKPKAICHDMKFCKANASGLKTKEVTPPVQNSGKGNNSCAYCSGVVTVLEFALNQNPGEVQEAREAAGIVCELLPSDDKCHADLKMFDTAVSQLKTGKQPHEICQALKFCTSADEAASVKLSDLRFLDPSLSPSRCTICKQNSLLLASMVAKPASLATFTAEMNSICRLIPDSKECTLLMKHHDTIIDALKNNEDIESICTRIHECKSVNQVAKPVEAEKSMTMGCLLCEYTAEMASRAAKDQNELRLAKVALETMCTILPPAARCDVLSSKFDELVALVQSGKSPSQACHSVALCDAAFVEDPKVAEAIERPDYLLPAEFAPIAMGEVMELE